MSLICVQVMTLATRDPALTSTAYRDFLDALKERVRQAQIRAVVAVNRELVCHYWEIGREILAREAEHGWGAKVIQQLSADLRKAFPQIKGFSARNLRYMRALAAAWAEPEFVQQAVAQIPWGHVVRILDKARTPEERAFYVAQTIENGWSRNILVAQIETGLYHRQGRAITNFERTLPAPGSDLAQQTLKDPYVFDFLELSAEISERDLERTLLEQIRSFLLELGVGFAFVGSQVHLEIGGEDFYLDMLFYHLRLRCYVVVELKTGEFRPEYAGKMNFYLSAVDEELRTEADGPTIGLLLCKAKNRVIVEYALRDTRKPIGVSEWQLTEALPESLAGSLPSVDDLEAELLDAIVDELRARVDTANEEELSETARAIYGLLVSKNVRDGEVAEPETPYGDLDEATKALAQIIETDARSRAWMGDEELRPDLLRRIRRQLTAAHYGQDEATRLAEQILDVMRYAPRHFVVAV